MAVAYGQSAPAIPGRRCGRSWASKPGSAFIVAGGSAAPAAAAGGRAEACARLLRLAEFDVALAFRHVAQRARRERLPRALPKLAEGAMIWVAWPKKASGVATGRDRGHRARCRVAARDGRRAKCARSTRRGQGVAAAARRTVAKTPERIANSGVFCRRHGRLPPHVNPITRPDHRPGIIARVARSRYRSGASPAVIHVFQKPVRPFPERTGGMRSCRSAGGYRVFIAAATTARPWRASPMSGHGHLAPPHAGMAAARRRKRDGFASGGSALSVNVLAEIRVACRKELAGVACCARMKSPKSCGGNSPYTP